MPEVAREGDEGAADNSEQDLDEIQRAKDLAEAEGVDIAMAGMARAMERRWEEGVDEGGYEGVVYLDT